jgi:hypothetical protein
VGGSSKSVATEQPKLASIQIQTSAYGGVVALVYGTNRVPGNLIWYGDFKPIPHSTTISGGKGGSGGSTTQTSYTYEAAVVLALAEGPIGGIGRVWRDKEIGSLAGYGFTLFVGNRSQSPWSYLTSKHPSEAIGYAGTAIVAAAQADLGSSGSLKNHSFEVYGLLRIGSGNNDAHPDEIVSDFLTNQFYGAGWPSARVGDLSSYRTYCTAAGLFLSPVFTEQKPALEHLREILAATNSAAVWSAGVLKIVPYGDVAVTGNGETFTPNTTPLYDLGPDDFLRYASQDPIEVERVTPADAFNSVPIEFLDAAQDFNPSVVEDPDPVDVEAFGLRKAQVRALHCITRSDVALQISRIAAQRNVSIRNEYTFRLGWKYAALEPMDLVTITDPVFGLDHKVVRIKSVEENESGDLTVVAEEWPFGVATATLYTPQGGDAAAPNVNADPGNANAPVLFDLPEMLTGGQAQLALATSGGSLWGGCEVWISYDGSTYSKIGVVENPSRHGVLASTFASGSQSDTVNTLAVDLAVSAGVLASCSAQDKDDLVTLSWVDGELVAYQNAALVSGNAYNLTTLRRGCYGTPIGSHSSATKFVRLDDAVFRYALPPSRIGSQVWVKLRSFNIYGGGLQDLSGLSAYTFTPASADFVPPYPSACSLSALTTPPASSSDQSRRNQEEANKGSGTDSSTGAPLVRNVRYAKVDWTFTAPYPAAMLEGFRVVLFEGSDPNDESKYLIEPQAVAAGVRSLVLTLTTGDSSRTFSAAVQALYDNLESAWRTSSGTAVIDPDTLGIARDSLGNVYANLDNLIPNPNSEMGTAAVGQDPEGNGLVNDAGNAYAGAWCRRLGSGVTGVAGLALTRRIPCFPGDLFVFAAALKRAGGSAAVTMYLEWYDSSGSLLSSATLAPTLTNGVYLETNFVGTAPAATVTVRAYVARAADAGGNAVYLDNLSLRRSVKTSQMEPDAGFRVLNALANSGTGTSDRTWYRGSIDPNTRGGAPNIAACTVTRRQWDTTLKLGRLELQLAPAADTDNLDAMRYAKVEWYRQSAAGTTGTLTALDTTFVGLPDRLYFAPGSDSNAGNKAFIDAVLQHSGVSSGFPACKVTLYNVHGPSDTHCFYAAAANADGSVLTDNGTSWPAGLTGGSGGGSGGGGGGGGQCPEVGTPVLLADGRTKPAGELRPGDLVWTRPEAGGAWGPYPVTRVEPAEAECLRVVFLDGRELVCSIGHRLSAGGAWRAVETLLPGDVVDGLPRGEVLGVRPAGVCRVVQVSIEIARTYVTAGLLSHNMKPRDA